MDVNKAVTYVFEDEKWLVKLGIGAVVSLFSFFIVPIFFLTGYMVAIARNVRNGEAEVLPEWDDWVELFMDGIAIFIGQMVYTLPFLVLAIVSTIVAIASGSLAENGNDILAAGLGVALFGIGCLMLLWLVAFIFITPAVVVQYIKEDQQFGSIFRFSEVIAIAKDNLANVMIALAVVFAFGLVLSLVSGILNLIPCIGTIASLVLSVVAGPYIMAVSGHMYGQFKA